MSLAWAISASDITVSHRSTWTSMKRVRQTMRTFSASWLRPPREPHRWLCPYKRSNTARMTATSVIFLRARQPPFAQIHA